MPASALRIARYTYLGGISLFLLGILVQTYFVGRYLWGLDSSNDLHAGLGWPMSHMFAPLLLLLSFFLKGGRTFWITSIVWGVLAIVQPILAVLNEEGPNELEALHPLNAMFLLVSTMWLAWRAWSWTSGEKPMVSLRPTSDATMPAMRR